MEHEDKIRGLLNPKDRDQAIEFQTIELDDQLVIHVVVDEGCLYYLWLIVSSDQLAHLQKLITTGQEERKTRTLDRFELVIVAESPESFELELMRARKEVKDISDHTQVRIAYPGD
jgi:hypothetical protein